MAEALSRRGALVSLDINVRPAFVDDWGGYNHRRRLPGFLDLASLIKVSDEDLTYFDIAPDAASLRNRFIDGHGCAILVVTRGTAGALIVTQETAMDVPAWQPPTVIDTVGAGDTFMAAILRGWPSGSGWTAPRCGRSAPTTLPTSAASRRSRSRPQLRPSGLRPADAPRSRGRQWGERRGRRHARSRSFSGFVDGIEPDDGRASSPQDINRHGGALDRMCGVKVGERGGSARNVSVAARREMAPMRRPFPVRTGSSRSRLRRRRHLQADQTVWRAVPWPAPPEPRGR